MRALQDKKFVEKLINKIAPEHKDRKGGYSRVYKKLSRRGDGATMAEISLISTLKSTEVKETEKVETKKDEKGN